MPINEYKNEEQSPKLVKEDSAIYFAQTEIKRMKEAILLSDTEKFRLFTKMMRIGMMLNKAKKYPLNP